MSASAIPEKTMPRALAEAKADERLARVGLRFDTRADYDTARDLLIDACTGADLFRDGEKCQRCGRRDRLCAMVSDAVWERLSGRTDGSGMLCLWCMDFLAEAAGIASSCTLWFGGNALHGTTQSDSDQEVDTRLLARAEKAEGALDRVRRALHDAGEDPGDCPPEFYGELVRQVHAERTAASVEASSAKEQLAEARKQERERAMRAICRSCAGEQIDVEVEVFQREVTGEWAHRWRPEYGQGSRRCDAAAIRALPEEE